MWLLCRKHLTWQLFIQLPRNNMKSPLTTSLRKQTPINKTRHETESNWRSIPYMTDEKSKFTYMKKIIILILLVITTKGFAQKANKLFGKDPIINLENFQQQRIHFGFFLGFNSYDFKIDYKTFSEDIQVEKSIGFNVGLIANLRLHEYIDLRFEPGLNYSEKILQYPKSYFSSSPSHSDLIRKVNSTYIHFPLLLKFSSLRTGNVRPYLVGGVSATLNLASNSKLKNDNYEEIFRVNSWTTNYELGFGIDIFSEYFIFSPSIRGVFGFNDEIIQDTNMPPGETSPWTGNIESLKSRVIFINFTFH